MRIRAATRGSPLARWQAKHVAELLQAVLPGLMVDLVIVQSSGDLDLLTPLDQLGGQGAFVKEIQVAVLEGRADIAVHSAKDLPAQTPSGLLLGAVPQRGDPRDALVGCRFRDLPLGAEIATGSIRRRAHLAHRRPDLRFSDLRGNIERRIERTAEFDAIVVALAALERLCISPEVCDPLDPAILLPQVGQGALAIECRREDSEILSLLQLIEEPSTRRAVNAERSFLAELGAGCGLPVAAHAEILSEGSIQLSSAVSSVSGDILLVDTRIGNDATMLGRAAARCLLDEQGGSHLLSQT